MSPNFIIAGGVATGTSFLSEALKSHPDIYLPRIHRPEPNFFHYSWKYKKGYDWYLATWFTESSNQCAVGERSSLLLTSESSPERIANNLPDARLIFCLRNPFTRAWANYRFTVLEGLESLPFEDALRLEEARMRSASGIWSEVQPHAYTFRSIYSSGIRRFQRYFRSDQILYVKSESLSANPQHELSRVCNFLGVESGYKLTLPPNFSAPSVLDMSLQSRLRQHFGNAFPDIVEMVRQDRLNSHPDLENSPELQSLRSNLTQRSMTIPQRAKEILEKSLKQEINEVEALTQIDCSDWMP
jgi:Sulfotransferase domain